MYHVAVLLEHVDLLDGLDGLHIELLERGLQLLVVRAGGLVHLLCLSSGCAFTTVDFILVSFESFVIFRSVSSQCYFSLRWIRDSGGGRAYPVRSSLVKNAFRSFSPGLSLIARHGAFQIKLTHQF